jgi:hypothetical protein
MSQAFVRSLLVVAPALITATNALAHDSWINRGAFKNAAGEWCCGDYDCKSYTRASSTTTGWMIDGVLCRSMRRCPWLRLTAKSPFVDDLTDRDAACLV